MNIRNLAIIAHVDHGKTTLIDGLFKQAGLFRSNQLVEERIMDSGELEKERGITITAKNASFTWKDVKVNIVDTPGHSDFGGEVERALFMVDGALLLVDAAEGPLPQTRFVLSKALQRNIKIIVVINKVDRPDARVHEIEEEILALFYELAGDDADINYKTLYASAREGWASLDFNTKKSDFTDLLDTIVTEVPAPRVNPDGPFQMIVTNLSYNSFMGQIAIGRIEAGSVKAMSNVVLIDETGTSKNFKIVTLETYAGLGTEKVQELVAGNIALVSGIENPQIGDTITTREHNQALPRIKVDPPMVGARISINTSPLAGKDGEYVTSRKLEELLQKACMANVALRYERTATAETYMLKARGELQIVVLLEQLRRQGYELMVGRPEIIPVKGDNGEELEPEELMTIDIPETMIGKITEILSARGGRMAHMELMKNSPRVRMEFVISTRALIGIRSLLMTETKGEAIFSSALRGFIPYQGKRLSRKNGAIVADRSGTSVEYGLFYLQARGKLFIREGMPVYEGMVFGEFNKSNNLLANPMKSKQLTNVRSVGHDVSTKLDPIQDMTLDFAIEWIDEDEWVEVTPKSIRIRKVELRSNMLNIFRE